MKLEVPIEYKKGYTKFLNCKIDLSKKVFIPRIETEFWVKKAIKDIKNDLQFTNCDLRILDIFAGSGCIGISILKNIKNSFVDFVDNDEKAISQIKINLKLNQILKNRYRIYQSDLFEKIKKKKYNFIFANPPYVAEDRIKEVQPSVLKYEPKRAILAGKTGLFYIRKFLKEAKNHLKKRGIIFLEFDPFQKKEIEKILKKDYKPSITSSHPSFCSGPAPNFKFHFLKDQFGKIRYAKIC